MFLKKEYIFSIVIFFLLTGTLLRFYNLNWGAPFYFHPDERNIASSVSKMQFPQQMNPHFFAYGSFPLYSIYSTGVLVNILMHKSPVFSLSFEQAILISRFFSAFFSLLIIPLVYQIARLVSSKRTGVLASFLVLTSTGFVQFAHFGTFEMWLTFFGTLLCYACLLLQQTITKKNLFWTSVLLGILIATKVSSLFLILIPIGILTAYHVPRKGFKKMSLQSFFLLVIALLIYILTSPFVFADFSSFLSSMQYESSVALGNLTVFYTEGFQNTVPVLFQFTKVYPFLLNPLMTIFFILSFFYFLLHIHKKHLGPHTIILSFYLVLFISQSFLFVKWTRYMIPTLPFIYLIIAFTIDDILVKTKTYRRGFLFFAACTGVVLLISVSTVHVFSYFATVFAKEDTRIAASLWAKNNIQGDKEIASEIYDLGITPFNTYFHAISLFNFYDLDATQKLDISDIHKSSYLILPSQRIFKSRLLSPNRFPQGHRFYTGVFSGKLGFKKVYQSPCDIFCKIIYIGDPINALEETVNVFDRPTVFIFEKK